MQVFFVLQDHHWCRNLGLTFKGNLLVFQKMTPFSTTFTTAMLRNQGKKKNGIINYEMQQMPFSSIEPTSLMSPSPPINFPIKLAPLSNHPSLKYTLLSSAPPQKVSLSKNPLFQIVLHQEGPEINKLHRPREVYKCLNK